MESHRYVVAMKALRGLYIHIPFCPQICPYCAFASLRGVDYLHERYVSALCKELSVWSRQYRKNPLQTIFIGGGTPTQIDPSLIGKVLEAADYAFGMCTDAEITVEANPSTVDREKFSKLRSVGCNRLSLGVQSFDNQALKKLGRVHSSEEAERAFTSAREAGFSNVSVDLIFSVPDVAEPVWQGSVNKAISLQPEHISVYALTIEEGTLFARREGEGSLVTLTEDDDAMQYEWTRNRLLDSGFKQYEVSNFAQEGWVSRHNWGYWTGAEYLGVGLSAHSHIGGERFWNVKDIEAYMQRVEENISPEEGRERIDVQTERRERFWLGLRTSQGVFLSEKELAVLKEHEHMNQCLKAEYLTLKKDRVLLAEKGWNIADGLAVKLTNILEDGSEVITQCV
ncbi:MAG: hypothetical protein CME28_07965 [Gemmatimonadetes bacterium]|nr:hypothetical protein [Gemmatimonadota bacterium]